ncbi:TPA: type II toxin-antitoxin system PemK/MazF family toxin [Yersinia enterocolitica]|nr:type II toxin-antitoxin system PemK/MazF family toxin [Yersinia enterocolitica]HDL6890665.1 type II toxin-antitoxin system PemK/MazF family toxin [Yersinia enterocolitica]HDL7358793.1 type II toxin-antitoxin system PemK/MazF family toxin [Yersinia enterocolitica]
MTGVTIKYFLLKNNPQDDQLLGTKWIENIEEVLVPISKKSKPFFITMVFTNVLTSRWRVEYVLGIAKDVWGIWLTEKDISDDMYLSSTLEIRGIKSAAQIVRKGTIVIVEYGHIYQSLNFRQGLLRSTRYPCSNQEGEMHKRRPAIVVSADTWGVKVVPITSVEPEGNTVNQSIFELETDSTKFISEFRPRSRSFALCDMIQSVSYSRILPPLAQPYNGRSRTFKRDIAYPRRLSKNDTDALEKGLLTTIGMAALKKKNDVLYAQNEKDKHAIANLTQQSEDATMQLSELRKRYAVLKSLYQGTSGTTSDPAVEDEIDEWISAGI